MEITCDAERLAIMFSDEIEIPAEYKNKTNFVRVPKEKETKIFLKFYENLKQWQMAIDLMLEKLPLDQANRFIKLTPEVEESTTKVTECLDFILFIEYLIFRRDIEKCGDEELGRLCMLSSAFQKVIENVISIKKSNKQSIHLTRQDVYDSEMSAKLI